MTWRVAGAARATTGKRAGQEDAFGLWPPHAEARPFMGKGMLAVVTDGMGGHAGGEVAGSLACETFVTVFAGLSAEEAAAAPSDRLKVALDAANAAIASRAAENTGLAGMGCTLVAAWLDREGLRWISVGDSLLLLFRAPNVRRLNADHSLGAFLDERARHREITRKEAERNPYRNALRSALTGKALELVDLRRVPYPLQPGDWLILASDGIATLTGDEICDLVYAAREVSPHDMAERLIAAVLDKDDPSQDNTTVVVLKIGEDPAAPDEAPTRVLRDEREPAEPIEDGEAATLQTAQPASALATARRHRALLFVLGMAVMFLAGWALRALVS